MINGGWNLDDSAECNFSGTSISNADPLLGPLEDNGGPTKTHALHPGSRAVNHVPVANASCPDTDQRGIPRPQGAACDIGAYESLGIATTLVAANAIGVQGGATTLRATLTETGNGAGLSGRTIVFALNGTQVCGTGAFPACPTTDSSGVAQLAGVGLGAITAGDYPEGVRASFATDNTHATSTDTAQLTVHAQPLATSVTAVGASPASVVYGTTSVTLSATVSNTSNGASLTGGTVTFNVPGVCSPAAVAVPTTGASVTVSTTCSPGTAAPGTYGVTATYSGDATFLTSSNSQGTLAITKAGTSVAIGTIATGCGATSVTVPVTVANTSNTAALTGGTVTVRIKQGETVVGTRSMNVSGANPATMQVAVPVGGLTLSSYTVEASYSGDTNFAGDAAAPSVIAIGKSAPTLVVPTVTATYGDGSVALTVSVAGASGTFGNSATFTFRVLKGNQALATITTGQVSAGTASVTLPLNANFNAGGYTVEASYSGNACYHPGTGTGTLSVGRKILWLKPQDRTVGLHQPNPATTPPAGCVAQATATRACWLELANGSTFAYGQSWSVLNLTALRFQYNRNPPATNASEYVGKTYRITAFGLASMNYDIRFQQGTLTVVP